MPEAFKNRFNENMIQGMANAISKEYAEFDSQRFIAIASRDLSCLALKQRSSQIMQALHACLPRDVMMSFEILQHSLASMDKHNPEEHLSDGIADWAIMPTADYVALVGQGHLNASLNLLREMTKRFSAEFAIRPFLANFPDETLTVIAGWLSDPNKHVRRLVSEGTRPRLPWGMQLALFIKDPEPVIPLLHALRDDDSEYVRRSVANHLNDIAKDHPDRLVEIAVDWLADASHLRYKLLRHGCRTLFKQGNPEILTAFGYQTPEIDSVVLTLENSVVHMGSELNFQLALASTTDREQNVMIDFVIYHQKANGSLTPKVFKWKDTVLKPYKAVSFAKRYRFTPITTRQYYSGRHEIALVINGQEIAREIFELVIH